MVRCRETSDVLFTSIVYCPILYFDRLKFIAMPKTNSLSSLSLVIQNVSTTPNVFELNKADSRSFCASPSSCVFSHQTIAFGDLADLKSVREAITNDAGAHQRKGYSSHRLYRNFSVGNYSVSVVNFEAEVKPVIIFHLENVDPSLVATVMFGFKDDDDSDKRECEASACDETSNKLYAIGPTDWFSAKRLSANNCAYKKRGNKRMKVDSVKKDAPVVDGAQRRSGLAASLKLVWKTNPGGGSARRKKASLDKLFYFVNGSAWFGPHYQYSPGRCYSEFGKVEISSSTGGVYQLRARNKMIGIAINTRDVFGDAEVAGVLIQEPYGGYYAVVLHGFVNHEFGRCLFPMESFLYESVYRSFFKLNEEVENLYYSHEDNESNFSLLPDTLFVKILLYLPWRQRIQCRRVNKRWMEMANLTTAIDTKIIDLSGNQYKDMCIDDLNLLLPIVSDYLEEFIWKSGRDTLDFDGVRRVEVFRKLRKIDLDSERPEFDDFFSMLDKCPKLKELTAHIPRRKSSSNCVPGTYEIEKLRLLNKNGLTDPGLIEIANYFPKLSSLRINGFTYLTSSCLSAVFEKYGETLNRLEANGQFGRFFSGSMDVFSTIGAVTGVEGCHNLEYLSLADTDFISDSFMTALAAGCAKLTTLDICNSRVATNEGLAALAALPNLKRLDISNGADNSDLSSGLAQLAKAGHLEQLLVRNSIHPSAACLKACVRYCRRLKLLDVNDCVTDLTADDAVEIVRLYGTWNLNSRLIFGTDNRVWRKREVKTVRLEVKESNHRRFLICPSCEIDCYCSGSKWVPDDYSSDEIDSDSDDYTDSDDEEVSHLDDSFDDHFGSDSDDFDDYSDADDYFYDMGPVCALI